MVVVLRYHSLVSSELGLGLLPTHDFAAGLVLLGFRVRVLHLHEFVLDFGQGRREEMALLLLLLERVPLLLIQSDHFEEGVEVFGGQVSVGARVWLPDLLVHVDVDGLLVLFRNGFENGDVGVVEFPPLNFVDLGLVDFLVGGLARRGFLAGRLGVEVELVLIGEFARVNKILLLFGFIPNQIGPQIFRRALRLASRRFELLGVSRLFFLLLQALGLDFRQPGLRLYLRKLHFKIITFLHYIFFS